ncbi:HTH-type transcriptional regulator DegA [Streptomyces sp. RB5]|uniref:HTH-type transcriptional regulator DegA n=1 Tax=Streptomyces smaragdinus TaxID=2585196 RepID=A0A7K0CKP3_9ACTN|nr:LacI family DNA-binding transcriptional regulator [Streptomyces smaragdinus]MQY14047.1 HTH-type transcriptional regulator DegA [Streptomyces smaragdinus]
MSAPTLRDVARHAGVSVRTVSNVVNNYAVVAATTRARVQASIDLLGYRPNLLARHLKQGRSRIIGLVVPELDVPYFAELARLIIARARARGYTVLIDQTDGDARRERELITEHAYALSFDGVIVSPLALTADDLRERRSGLPLLLLGEKLFGGGADHVAIDNVGAAREATAHLLAAGRRRIAAIGVQPGAVTGTAALRVQGYRLALAEAGVEPDESLLVPAARYHRANGAAAMAGLLDRPDPPDAVFCFNDLLALGALRVALTRGLRVPQDLAVVGFDDIEDGRYSTPTLTTVAPDKELLARHAVEQLLGRIEDGDTGDPLELRTPYRLIVRESAPRGSRRVGHP